MVRALMPGDGDQRIAAQLLTRVEPAALELRLHHLFVVTFSATPSKRLTRAPLVGGTRCGEVSRMSTVSNIISPPLPAADG